MVKRRQAVSSASQQRNRVLWVDKFLSVITIRQLFFVIASLLFLAGVFLGYKAVQIIDVFPIEKVQN